jgi:hypothetical protein
MAVALDHTAALVEPRVHAHTGLIGAAGMASLGAGAIHAAAIGVHAEHRQAALTFTAIAIIQLCWGGLALVRSGRLVALTGALIGVGAVAGWAIAKRTGLSFIEGLDVAEPIQSADAVAAGLAFGSLLLITVSVLAGRRRRSGAPVVALPMLLSAFGVTAITAFGMVSAGTHAHSGGEGHAAAGDHHDGTATDGADHIAAAAVAPVPYDPTKPIDLGGVEGVTPEQQAAAENLVSVTLLRLPQWSDPAVAEAAGFQSIGDGFTGVEHFVNTEFMEDDVILDPDRPESLVYDTSGGGRRLAAAMYMIKRGTPLEDAPTIGGRLIQWHTHENLCFTADGKVAGLTDADGSCPAGLFKPEPTPMIHVWIEKHPCGPFAALEGIGGGRVPDGEVPLCDHAHGAS